MLQAFALGAIAQSSLLLSGIVPFFLRIPDRIIGILAGFGAGALLAAVAFDLVPEAISVAEVAIWFFVGALIFIVADRIIEARFGGEGGAATAAAHWGSCWDRSLTACPESLDLRDPDRGWRPDQSRLPGGGLRVQHPAGAGPVIRPHPVRLASRPHGRTCGAPWCSPAVSPRPSAGWRRPIVDTVTGARAAAIAAGGVLAMLTASLVPFAYQKGGAGAALGVVAGVLRVDVADLTP